MADTEETTEETESTYVPGGRSQTAIHQGQVDWIAEEHDIDLAESTPAEIISIAYATRNAWRKTEAYAELKAEVAEQREAEKAERAEARAARKAEREAAKAAAEAEAAEAEDGDAKPARKGKNAAATKAAAKPARKRKSKAAASDDGDDENPFD